MRFSLLFPVAAVAALLPSARASVAASTCLSCQEPETGKPAAKPAEKAAEKPPDGKAEKAGKGAKDAKSATAGEAVWMTAYADALARAKKEKKLILADFTGSDWCGWCIKLKEEVFSKPEFQKWAQKNVILLEVDFPRKTELPKELKQQNDKLAREFKIEGYPTILFINAKGKQVGQMGYQEGGPDKWTQDADKILKKAK